jgi:hypothetical protein
VGDTILPLNAHHETIALMLPALKEGQQWEHLLETAERSVTPAPVEGQHPNTLPGRLMAGLRTTRPHDDAREPLMTSAVLQPSGRCHRSPDLERNDHAVRQPYTAPAVYPR